MKILFVSSTLSKEKYNQIRNIRTKKILDPSQKFFHLLLTGMAQQKEVDITCLSALPVSSSTAVKKLWKNESELDANGIRYNYLGFYNGRFGRYITLYFSALLRTLEWLLANKEYEEKVIICDPLTFMIARPARFLSMLFRTRSVAFITDIPTLATTMKNRKYSFIRRYFQKIYETSASNDLKRYDAYIFIVKAMNELLKNQKKPFLTVEGSVDYELAKTENFKDSNGSPRIIMYAGGIYKKFGIPNLIEAFKLIDLSDVELHIYGDGNYIQEILEAAKDDNRIKYLGVLSPDDVFEKEISSDLLINCRPNDDIFTKYSFPSKTLEYMVSGTPVITTKLDGIPEEYNPYLFYFEDASVESIRNKLLDVLSLPDQELRSKGNEAKRFALSVKNNHIQGEKIIKFIKKSVLRIEED